MSSLDHGHVPDGGHAVRRGTGWRLYAVLIVFAFLAGLIPTWLTCRQRARERDEAQSALRVSTLQNTLANAAIDARRNEYESARQAASDFFTNLQAEIDRGESSVFTEAQRNSLRPVFATRDDTITLLARSDPASLDRLADLYARYRQAAQGGAPPGAR